MEESKFSLAKACMIPMPVPPFVLPEILVAFSNRASSPILREYKISVLLNNSVPSLKN